MATETYRDHVIYFYAPPIPIRSCDWHFYHKDYDGPEDGRHGDGPSLDDCKAQIDDWWLEQDCLSSTEQKYQSFRCACNGQDDYCPCQNMADKQTKADRAAKLKEAGQ
jgi:hypothetical protein